ncbi:hypothetical protein Cs7R123_34650 [Catellatospora sp. TT07R-123]|uniref:hypothetical protein n=1 Tax=Catellatospora sp. TT07R-123 TaxID=2733863 RepID=UPI001B22CC94|nr:hypothetical protein [Catellatospora sp. TT07R-123]GHJ46123.1 hypothetical protein Cs7R123_34650 [Catellatospora sp. TT07R-123]
MPPPDRPSDPRPADPGPPEDYNAELHYYVVYATEADRRRDAPPLTVLITGRSHADVRYRGYEHCLLWRHREGAWVYDPGWGRALRPEFDDTWDPVRPEQAAALAARIEGATPLPDPDTVREVFWRTEREIRDRSHRRAPSLRVDGRQVWVERVRWMTRHRLEPLCRELGLPATALVEPLPVDTELSGRDVAVAGRGGRLSVQLDAVGVCTVRLTVATTEDLSAPAGDLIALMKDAVDAAEQVRTASTREAVWGEDRIRLDRPAVLGRSSEHASLDDCDLQFGAWFAISADGSMETWLFACACDEEVILGQRIRDADTVRPGDRLWFLDDSAIAPLRLARAACPAPLDPACDCPVHRNLRMSHLPTGNAKLIAQTLDGLPLLRPLDDPSW